MSQPDHEAFNMAEMPGVETGAGHPPQSGQQHPPQGQSVYADSSGPLFSMYLKLAGEEDKKMTENWTGDADGILIFTGLFSAAVAAFVTVSLQDLKPSSQDISAFYLANIYQTFNGSQVVIPPTLPDPSIPFSPPTSAVWVNSLWILSLLISLTCALLATLLQQWARRYTKVTQTRYSPDQRARIRAFFAEGVEKLHLPWAVEALPTLLHLSLFLFFAGLAVFLFGINDTVFKVAISWIGFCTGMYMCITLMPTFRPDSPYYAPLSSAAWYLYTGIGFTLFRILWWVKRRRNPMITEMPRVMDLRWIYWRRILRGMEEEFKETALRAPSEIVDRALKWTCESLDEDHELEQFLSGIIGFCNSKAVDDPQSSLDHLRSWPVAKALDRFLERTWSSNLVSETIKIRRLAIYVRVIVAANLFRAAYFFFGRALLFPPGFFQSVELGHSLISWSNNDDQTTTLFAQSIIACIIAKVPQRNERWFSLTMHHLGISEHVLRGYLDHGDSVLLANLIHLTRQFVVEANWGLFPISLFQCLQSNYNVRDTLPELQHDFCRLWNEIVEQRRDIEHSRLSEIFETLYPIYLALHGGPAETTQYRLCSIPGHLRVMEPASNLNVFDGGKTAEAVRALITTSPPLHYLHAVPSAIPPVSENYALPSPTSNLDHAILHVVGGQSSNGLLGNISPVAPSLHPAPLEKHRTSDGTAADPMQGTTGHSAISSMVDTGFRSVSSHGTASRLTRNMPTATPSFVPDTGPSPIPLLTVNPDRAASHISADPTVNESGGPRDDGSISHSSSQILTPFPLAPQVISGFDSNATPEIGPLDAPDDTLDPNRRVVSQSLMQPFPDITANSPRLEDHDQSENLA